MLSVVLGMEERKVLKVDMGQLVWAMNDGSIDFEYYLDMETGEIILVGDDFIDMEELYAASEAIEEEEAERYRYIDKTDSWDAYKDMERFIITVEDKRLRELLIVAIDGRGAFRRFRKVIWEHPEEKIRWSEFKDRSDMQRALEFLDCIGVDLIEES